MKHSRFLAHLILAALLYQVNSSNITVEEMENKVFLHCNASVVWLEGTVGTELPVSKYLDLGKRVLDPRGMYMCKGENEDQESTVQIYYRTADTQALLRNEQLYQPLRDHDDGQYSRLGGNWARNK
uniref:T-cell surface glycoprotein CD3 delta chain n=1 Tax=Sciurus vulgaris TaxID=55149 RepID=A0A8D2JSB7_SCIVU